MIVILKKGRQIQFLVFEETFDNDYSKDHNLKWNQDIFSRRKHIR